MNTPEKDQPLILSLHYRGNVKFPRYIVSDQYLRYWTGEDWTEQHNEAKAFVYASVNAAMEDMHKLLKATYKDKPVFKYVVPLHIELFSDQKVNMNDLIQWLVNSTKLIMDTPKHGNGPMVGSYGSCRIDYSELKEEK